MCVCVCVCLHFFPRRLGAATDTHPATASRADEGGRRQRQAEAHGARSSFFHVVPRRRRLKLRHGIPFFCQAIVEQTTSSHLTDKHLTIP